MFKSSSQQRSPKAGRALAKAIHLAKSLGAGLGAITVLEELQPYAAYAAAADFSRRKEG